MDLAAESLALAYFAKKDGSTETLIRSYNIYTIALSNLTTAIQDHRSRLASETLSATLLLVHFEVRETALHVLLYSLTVLQELRCYAK